MKLSYYGLFKTTEKLSLVLLLWKKDIVFFFIWPVLYVGESIFWFPCRPGYVFSFMDMETDTHCNGGNSAARAEPGKVCMESSAVAHNWNRVSNRGTWQGIRLAEGYLKLPTSVSYSSWGIPYKKNRQRERSLIKKVIHTQSKRLLKADIFVTHLTSE